MSQGGSLKPVFGLLLTGGGVVLLVGLFSGKITFPLGTSSSSSTNSNSSNQQSVKNALTIAQANQYAAQAGFTGSGLKTIVAIAQAESGLNTNALNCSNPGGSCDRGIVQINSAWHNEVTDTCAYDPLCAFQQAYRISNSGTNFSAWTTFTSGSYKQYLNS